MSNLTVKDVCITVRSFLDEIKKTQFFFDIISVDLLDGEWEVECEVANHAEDEGIEYLIRLSDATGEILHISRQDDDPDDDGGEDEEEGDEGGTDTGQAASLGGDGSPDRTRAEGW